jgi:hypothetical protein
VSPNADGRVVMCADLCGAVAEIATAERLRVQGVIAMLRRVLVMVISIGGFVEVGR